jgi:hypothetical protein
MAMRKKVAKSTFKMETNSEVSIQMNCSMEKAITNGETKPSMKEIFNKIKNRVSANGLLPLMQEVLRHFI